MMTNIFVFVAALAAVIQGSTMATRRASDLARGFGLSPYTVGFIVVAIISILPETFISVNAAVQGIPSFGLGMLFGSNIADLTLVFALIIFVAGRGLKIESKIIKKHKVYPFLLLLPLVLGFDGHFSRVEGAALVIIGAAFYFNVWKDGGDGKKIPKGAKDGRVKHALLLLVAMAILLVGAHFTVDSAAGIAEALGVNPILIGMLIVGLGTTLPEFFFALKSVRKKDDSLAVGDLLGTVLADALIVVGILALISPFDFPQTIIYVTGVFMVGASVILYRFMQTGRRITMREGFLLFVFWVVFVVTEYLVNA